MLQPPTGGTLPSTVTLQFEFNHPTRGNVCNVPVAGVPVATSGAFTAPVSLSGCPNRGRDLFDGEPITYSVRQTAPTAEVLVVGAAITPVPYARFADQVGVNNACPVGYALVSATGGVTVCNRTFAGGRDEVVKVGTGASAFWVDRYEATVFTTAGVRIDSYTVLDDSGQWSADPAGSRDSLLAVSRPGVTPSANMTWFQARALCRAAGKRMMTRDEWFAAADGLTRVETSATHNCNVSNTPAGARATGMGDRCASTWGAQDMVGNLWEWTDEWYASVGISGPTSTTGGRTDGRRVNDSLTNGPRGGWPSSFGGDATWNITSVVHRGDDDDVIGIPSAAVRGGTWNAGAEAGVFALSLNRGPSAQNASVGFRCVVPGA